MYEQRDCLKYIWSIILLLSPLMAFTWFHLPRLIASNLPRMIMTCSVTRWLYYIFNICPFETMKMGSIALKYFQRRLNILPIMNKTRKQLSKTLKMLLLWRNFTKSGHTDDLGLRDLYDLTWRRKDRERVGNERIVCRQAGGRVDFRLWHEYNFLATFESNYPHLIPPVVDVIKLFLEDI